MDGEEAALEATSDIATICSQVQTLVNMPPDPDEPDAPSPNRVHVNKAVASVWRVRVRPFCTALMRYMSALENTKDLTESESRESGAAI